MKQGLDKQQIIKLNEELIRFIADSPTAYQAVGQVSKRLRAAGFVQQEEGESWTGGPYVMKGFAVRNGSSLIAYTIPAKRPLRGFHIVCAHTDSPAFKIKENPVQTDGYGYQKLNVEKYGGLIAATWMDRPLSAAGRVVYEKEGRLMTEGIDLKEPLFMIPSLAIHMTKGEPQQPLKIQQDLQPISAASRDLYELLASALDGVEKDAILGSDLFLYNSQPGCLLGAENPLVCAPRLDDLQCVFAALNGFLAADSSGDQIQVLSLFDNEEVGSLSRQGAASDFMSTALENIAEQSGLTRDSYRHMLAGSFMISADNAHAVHPNHAEKADPTNRPMLNQGIVIKYHGGQKYTTDAYTGACIKQLCKTGGIPYQTYHNHSDIAGGSTLGNVVLGNVSVLAADIGAPQLAMHSSFETAGALDTVYLKDLFRRFYNHSFR